MRIYQVAFFVSMLCVTTIAVADSITSNAGSTRLISSPQFRDFLSSAITSKYALAVGRSLENWETNILGPSFACTITNVDGSGVVSGVGQTRVIDKFFVKTQPSTNNHCYVRLRYYECVSANAVRLYFLMYVAPIYSGGPPRINKTYGIGDVVLAFQDKNQVTDRASFVVFFNNIAIDCDISSEGDKNQIDMTTILRNLENWAKTVSSKSSKE